jgi:hypothetical protein
MGYGYKCGDADNNSLNFVSFVPLFFLGLFLGIWCSVKYFMTFWTQKKFNNVFEENRNVILKGTKC